MALHSQASEEMVIGAILLRGSQAFAEVEKTLVASDFYSIRLASVYDAMSRLHASGLAIDVVTVQAKLTEMGSGWESIQTDLVTLLAGAMYDRLEAYAYIVAEYSAKRKIQKFAVELSEVCMEDFDLDEMLGVVENRVATLESPTTHGFESRPVLDLILDDVAEVQWLVENFLAVDSRCIVIAPEGAGKSVLMRQIGLSIALGIHPFKNLNITPRKVLYFDLENPLHVVHEGFMKVWLKLDRSMTRPAEIEIVHKPEGLDIRSRKHLGMFEATLAEKQPDLVIIAPLYKLARKHRGESDEDIAADLQAILDDLRIRYGFALILEHHAPKGQGGTREMTPFGSSLWLRWPEVGIGIEVDKEDPNVRHVGGFRIHRHVSEWPKKLVVGNTRPWEAIY